MRSIKAKQIATLMALVSSVWLTACESESSTPTDENKNQTSTLTITPGPFKTLAFNWSAITGVDHYQLIEFADGTPASQSIVDANIAADTLNYSLEVPLFARTQARYSLDACFDSGTDDCSEAASQTVSGNLVSSVGYFKASDASQFSQFGNAVALSKDGQTMAVAPAFNQNKFYIYRQQEGTWVEQSRLVANLVAPREFEIDLSLSGDGTTLVVGAGNIDDGGPLEPGSVLIYERNDEDWQAVLTLSGADFDNDYNFGRSVRLSQDGKTLAVGSADKNNRTGAVYLFAKDDTGWNPSPFSTLNGSAADQRFGRAVALNHNGSLLAVGAFDQVLAYRLSSGSATQLGSVIKGRNTQNGHQFGDSAMALSGDGDSNATLAVGAQGEDNSSAGVKNGDNAPTTTDKAAVGSGAAYVFTFSNGDWQQQAYLKASNVDAGDAFGNSLSLSSDGNSLVVSAVGEKSDARGVYAGSELGAADNNNDDDQPGAAYLFQRDATGLWRQSSYIKASNRSKRFGSAVSLSGDARSLAIGTAVEDNNASGIHASPPEGGKLTESGAVYLY